MSWQYAVWSMCALSMLWTNQVKAVDRQWNQTSGIQIYNNGANWTPAGVPVAGDNVTFGLDGDVDVFLGAPSVANNITFTDGIVEFLDVGGTMLNSAGAVTIDETSTTALADAVHVMLNGSKWNSTGDAFIGDVGRGRLTVTSSGVFEGPQLFVGNDAGSMGEVNVSGLNSQINIAGAPNPTFYVGQEGSGALNVSAGASVVGSNLRVGNEITGNGTVQVSGAGTIIDVSQVYVGPNGKGDLTVSEGALVEATTMQLAKEGTGDVHVLVSGSANGTPSTLRVVDRLDLGDPDNLSGAAVLDVADGGLVTIGDSLFFGSNNSQTVNVSDTGSSLQITGKSFIGNGVGTGTLNVMGGASASSADVDLGNESNGTGVVNVDGHGSNWSVSGALRVGEYGIGNLNLTGGGLVNSNGGDIGLENNGTGTADVSGSGSVWNAAAHGTDTLRVGILGDGALDVTSGGRVDADEFFAGDGADSTGSASVLIDGDDGNGGASIVNVATTAQIGVTHAANLTISNGGVLNTSTSGDFDFVIDYDQASTGGSVVNVDGAGSQLNHQGTGAIVVGRGGVGAPELAATLSVTGGGAVATTDLEIAYFGPSYGVVTVGDPGSRIDASSNISVGAQGTGSLLIENGGVVTAQNRVEISGFRSNGTATVTGVGSQLTAGTSLTVANFHPDGFNGFATGTLTIADGGTVANTGDGFIAGRLANIGTVNVGDGGAPAAWNNGSSLFVGGGNGNGSATLNVNAGGIVNVDDTLHVASDATVNLDGGEINVDALEIADPNDFNFNAGTLRLTGDETLDAAAYTQYFAGVANPALGADQHLAVTGAATLAAPITLNHATAALSVGSTSDLSNVTWNAGALNFTNQDVTIATAGLLGGLVTIDQDQALGVPNNRLDVQTLANLNVIGGGLTTGSAINDGRIFISNAAAIDFNADDVGAGLVNNEDLVVADSSIAGDIVNNGDFEVAGNVALANNLMLGTAGTIEFLLGGTLAGDYGALAIDGAVGLGGTLEVSLTGGFMLADGDTFKIIDVAGAANGTFAGLADGALVGRFGNVDLFINYNRGDGNDVVLSTQSVVNVDLDHDGDVDGVDFLLIQRTNPALIPQWQSQFGSASPVKAFTNAVPEPATLWMILSGSVLVMLLRGETQNISADRSQANQADCRAFDAVT